MLVRPAAPPWPGTTVFQPAGGLSYAAPGAAGLYAPAGAALAPPSGATIAQARPFVAGAGATAVVASAGAAGAAGAAAAAVHPSAVGGAPATARERQLEQRVRELEAELAQKNRLIEELRAGAQARPPVRAAGGGQARPGRPSEPKPAVRYVAHEQDDPIDVRLEEFYNSTGSVIQFRKINRGFYRFGETICEVDIINHKLMARTEDGWNHGKFGPIEKFLVYYENIERERAGITPEA